MSDHEIRAVADNLLQALRFFGQARQDAEIRDVPGMTLIFCGLNYAAFNAALLARPIETDRNELVRSIQLAISQFDAKNLRWTYWLCDDFLSQPLRRESAHLFGMYGLRPLTEAPGMYAHGLAPPDRPLPPIALRDVADEPTRAAFAEIMSNAFDIPQSVSDAVYGAERAWQGKFRGYVGYSNGMPVTTAAAMITGDVIGLYSVATLPRYRRLGFAEAIMRKVIEQSGFERSVLQSTSSGFSLYEKMGYRAVTKFRVYIAG